LSTIFVSGALILGTVGLAQLMVVLDATIVNIALPSAQRVVDFTTVDRQRVVTAYALAFGSLVLLGGRLGDLIGRKITFLDGELDDDPAVLFRAPARHSIGRYPSKPLVIKAYVPRPRRQIAAGPHGNDRLCGA
jgi:hypothetical protein